MDKPERTVGMQAFQHKELFSWAQKATMICILFPVIVLFTLNFAKNLKHWCFSEFIFHWLKKSKLLHVTGPHSTKTHAQQLLNRTEKFWALVKCYMTFTRTCIFLIFSYTCSLFITHPLDEWLQKMLACSLSFQTVVCLSWAIWNCNNLIFVDKNNYHNNICIQGCNLNFCLHKFDWFLLLETIRKE